MVHGHDHHGLGAGKQALGAHHDGGIPASIYTAESDYVGA
jgi:hypothetical protein